MDNSRAFEILGLIQTASRNDILNKFKILKIKAMSINDKKMADLVEARDTALQEADKYEPIFIPWNKSLVIYIVAFPSVFLRLFNPLFWFCLLFKRKKTNYEKLYDRIFKVEIGFCCPLLIEIWVFSLLCLEFYALIKAQPNGSLLRWYNIIAVFGLINILGETMDEFFHPIKLQTDYIRIRNITRWLILAGINVLQVILCFAILIKSYALQFDSCVFQLNINETMDSITV